MIIEEKAAKKSNIKKSIYSAKPEEKKERKYIKTTATTSMAEKNRRKAIMVRGSKFLDKILKIKEEEYKKRKKPNKLINKKIFRYDGGKPLSKQKWYREIK